MNYSEEIGRILIQKGYKISTVESCTGGLLSSVLTDVSGSSAYITLNLVTYANQAKERMLKVVINEEGVVSESCATQMVKGLYNLTNSEICVSTTGIAGPTGGTNEKPVGLMYSAILSPCGIKVYKVQVDPKLSRQEIKKQFVDRVLVNIYELLNS